MALTHRQQRFIEEYVRCGNGAEAARRAGYSPRSARQRASLNLQNPEIHARLSERVAEVALAADEILVRLSEVARGSLGDFLHVGEDGRVTVDLRKPAEAGMLDLIKKWNSTPKGVEIQLHDPLAALIQLGKYHGLFRVQPEVDWRLELRALGIDDQEVYDKLVNEFIPSFFPEP